MIDKKKVQNLMDKVDLVKKDNKLDLSSGEDLSIGIMNLISIEEHLFFSANKTGKKEYIDLLDEVRRMRTELMKDIIKEYEGEVWCISKHLLAASMRVMEVGTKELKKGNKTKAWDLFEKSYKLYSLFWGLNLKMVKMDDIKRDSDDVMFVDEKAEKFQKVSIFSKMGDFVNKALDCCRE
jgi:hypothetical protein